MDFLGTIWGVFWGTLLNILVTINTGLSQIIPNQAITAGLSIIIFTILMRLLTVPLTMKALRSSRNMQQVQPIIKEVQRKYKDDRQKQQEELMKVYQQYGINPAAGCFPMLIQIPVFIGLYSALMFTLQLTLPPDATQQTIQTVHQRLAELHNMLWVKDWASYANFAQPFLWIANLGHPDNLFILPVLSGVFQFIQSRMSMPRRDPNNPMDSQTKMMQNLMQFMPIYIIFISWNFAAGAVLYWAFSSLFGAVQQYFITGFGSLPDFPGFGWLPRKPIEPPKPIQPLSEDQAARKQSRGVMTWMMEKAKQAQETQPAADATAGGQAGRPRKGSEPSDGAEPASARARVSGNATSPSGPTRPSKVVGRTNRYAAALKQSEVVAETGSVSGRAGGRSSRSTTGGASSGMRGQGNGTESLATSSAQLPRKNRNKR